MSLSLKIIFLILCLLIGFVFPLAFIGAVAIGFGILSDLAKDPDAPAKDLQSGGAGSRLFKQRDHFRRVAESPAEEAFFDAMALEFSLEVQDRKSGKLTGNEGMTLDMQVEVMSYRLDFLVDKRLVVEIDGAAWHSSPEAQKRDRERDANLKEVGYHILRIPAKHVLYSPSVAIKAVRDARARVQLEDDQNLEDRIRAAKAGGAPVGTPMAQLKEAIRPKRLLSALSEMADGVEAFNARLDEIHKQQVAAGEVEAKLLAERSAIFAQYTSDLEQCRSREDFLSLVRKAEIERVMVHESPSVADYEYLFNLDQRHQDERDRAWNTLHRHLERDVRPFNAKLGALNIPTFEAVGPVARKKPMDEEGWDRWIKNAYSASSRSWHPSKPIAPPKVALPPIEADVEGWRSSVHQLVEHHYPLPVALK